MLQRIQSIYLLLAALVIFALYLFPLSHNVPVNGNLSIVTIAGVYNAAGGQQTQAFTPLAVVTAIVGLIPVILIFLYKNRKQQVLLCYLTIVIIIGFSFWVANTVKTATGGYEMHASNFGIGIFLSSISIVLLIMAAKAIQKDEKLVRSADRLR